MSVGPFAVTRCRVEVPYPSQFDEAAFPVTGHAAYRFQAGEVVVVAGADQAGERQRLARQWRPAIGMQGFRARIVLGPGGVQVWRGRKQRTLDRPAVAGCPVHHHEHTGAVGHQDHRAVDLLQLMLDGLDPCRQAQLVLLQRRNAANPEA